MMPGYARRSSAPPTGASAPRCTVTGRCRAAALQERLFTLAFRKLVYPADLGGPDRRLEALRLRPDGPRRRDRLGRLQRAVLSRRRSRRDHRRRSQRRPYRAQPPENLPRFAALPDHAAFFDFFGRADSRDNIALYDAEAAPAPRRGDPRLLGRARPRRAAAHRRLRAQFLSPRPARAFHRRRPCGRQALWQAARRRAGGRHARPSSAVAFEREIAPLFEKRFVRWLAAPPSALYGLGIPPGAISRAGRRRARRHRRGAEAPRRAARLRLSGAATIISPGRRSAAATRSRDDPSLPPYLQAAQFRGVARARRPRADVPRLVDRAARARSPARASTPMCCSTRRTG